MFRLHWPAATILTFGVVASLWLSRIAWSAVAILLAGCVCTGAIVWLLSRVRTVRATRLPPARSHTVAEPASARAAVNLAKELLSKQIESMTDSVLKLDDDPPHVWINQTLAQTWMMSPQSVPLADDALFEAVLAPMKEPDLFRAAVADFKLAPDSPFVRTIEFADGRTFEFHAGSMQGSPGVSPSRVCFFVFQDVSERTNVERKLAEERDFVTVLLNSLPGYFVLIDGAGRLIRWNESLRKLNGLSNDDILGSDPFANIVAGDRAATMSKVRETIEKGFGELEFGIHTKARGIIRIRWHGRRIVVNGDPQVLAIGIDLTEIRDAEAQLRASEERFRVIFESLTDGILVQDALTGVFLEANPHVCEMLGYSREELLALHSEYFAADSTSSARAQLTTLRTSDDGTTIVYERMIRAKDGHAVWCEVLARHLSDFGGRDVVFSTLRNITERREATAALSYRDRILHALTVSIAALVKTSSSATSLPPLLQSVGEELGVDRLHVVEHEGMEHEPSGALLRYGWERDGLPHLDLAIVAPHLDQAPYAAAVQKWLSPLREGLPVATDAATADEPIRSILVAGSALSNLLVPIFVGGSYWGVIGLDDVHSERTWTSIEIEALRTLADVIGALFTRERVEGALQKSEVQFRMVSESVFDAIVMIKLDGQICFWNPAAERIFGYSAAEAEGKVFFGWVINELASAGASREMAAAFATEAVLGQTLELSATRKDGAVIDIECSINGMTVGLEHFAVGIVRDITERKRASALIERMARYDVLTGLPNRRLFFEALDQAMARERRSKEGFAVLSFDLDRFKAVNDTFGHPMGDRLLVAVAERLRAAVRGVDTVARFGGDEFATVALDVRDKADAAFLAGKLVRALGDPFFVDGHEIHVGGSCGIAVFGPDSPDVEALLAHADVALYRAKADGRGTYRFYSDAMDAEVRERISLDGDLRDAVAQGQFFLAYQPQVEIATGRIVGLEALVRWQHPVRGVLEPAAFIAAVERNGLIVPLGAWVLREACLQMKQWLDAGIAPLRISINVSALQFKAPSEFEQSVTAILAESCLPPQRLELELTESVLLGVLQQSNDVLAGLRRMGASIAIDDFGNGSSSLAYLGRCNVDRIKIPRNFVEHLDTASDDSPIVRATLGLAHEMGIPAVAVGVETAAQFELLGAWGCQEAQGFYLARPLRAAETGALLRIGTVPREHEQLMLATRPV